VTAVPDPAALSHHSVHAPIGHLPPQFFITLAPTPWLDGKVGNVAHAAAGRVIFSPRPCPAHAHPQGVHHCARQHCHRAAGGSASHPCPDRCVCLSFPWMLHPLQHTIFGRVCSGMDVIKRLGNVQTDATDRPTTAVKIVRARPA
jgi:cyclophilin family peptidyl-prolyl cis-trans isomerase